MDEQMEEVFEKIYVFDESLEIDFEYEFDVAKYFDFFRLETVEEIEESERWFNLAEGHPPSPLLLKLGLATEVLGGSGTSSPKYAHDMTDDGGQSEILTRHQGKKGAVLLRSKSTNQSRLSKYSRLLQPTASHLAKQNLYVGVRGMTAPGRVQKLERAIKSPGDIAATKRQKLEHGYLSKVAHLKHQPGFSHKLPKTVVGSSNVNCHARLKVTVPKEPSLETANRAQRYRSKNGTEQSRDSQYDSCSVRMQPSNTKISEPKLKHAQSLASELQSAGVDNAKGTTKNGKLLATKRSKSFNASMHKESDKIHRLKARPLMKKILSSEGEIGAVQKSKRETTIKKGSKRTDCKKLLETPLTELFSRLSLNSENQMSLVVEDDQYLQKKDLKKTGRCSTKENKNATTVIGKSTGCSPKQSQVSGGRVTDRKSTH